jgi:hypothetical protein
VIDVNTFIGPYPFRHVPHPDADALVRVLNREGVDGAWVAHLPSAFYRDPGPGNDELHAALAPYAGPLRPVFTVRPDWPAWRDALARAVARDAVAIRAYPQLWGLSPGSAALAELAIECAAYGIALVLTVRFEDARQRHPQDVSRELSGADIRELARANTGARLLITGAGRSLIEEVHWGLTPGERSLLWWDISWIWGPPEDDLAHLLSSVGRERFVYGSGWPLRLAQTPKANLALLPDSLMGTSLGSLE